MMDVAALSIALSNTQVQRDANIAVMQKAMQAFTQQSTDLVELMTDPSPSAPHPVAGNRIDTQI